MSFTLGLAILGGALTLGVQNYLRTVSHQERAVREAIRLESAANQILGRAAAGEAIELGASEVSGAVVEVSLTGAKIDIRTDSSEVIEKAGEELGLPIRLAPARAASGLAELSNALGLSASQEDCLRRVFTYGRGGAPLVRPEDLPKPWLARAGDQVDIRVTVEGASTVLWVRARFTGRENGWRVHDYRRLSGLCPSE